MSYGIAAALLALTVAVVPMIAFAQSAPTERSVQISSSSAGQTGVRYTVQFTAASAGQAFALQFCKNTPMIGFTCEAPDGFSTQTATATGGAISVSPRDANTMVITPSEDFATNDVVTVTLDGVANPTSAEDNLYARIVTYDTTANAEGYTATNLGTGVQDSGSVAIAITPTVGVSGTVLETLLFCVSGEVIEANCAGANTASPVVRLGQETPADSGNFVMVPGEINEGEVYTQITTNAANGAVVYLKSSATCGGLLRAGTSECDIAAATNQGLNEADDSARFGVRVGASTGTASVATASGALLPHPTSLYAGGVEPNPFAFNYVAGHATGVTSPFGDEFMSTGEDPANNQNVTLTFGATVGNSTPGGLYSTDISLIAVGKF